MLSAFFTPTKLESLCSLFLNAPHSHDNREFVQPERIDNVWLLSNGTLKAVEKGNLAFTICAYGDNGDTTLQQRVSHYYRDKDRVF